jgi:hypothetical protein
LSYYPKTCNFTICSIYRHGGHDGWSAGSLDIYFKGNTLRMIQAKFGLNWSSDFRREYFWKSLDGRQMPSDGNSSHRWAKNVMAQTRKYYLKNNYLTLRSKVKVPRRSLWYATHRLMVMYLHTKYNWPIWKDKKVMVRTSFAEKMRKKKKSD